MKKVEQLKAGMEVWMKFCVEENDSETYPFKLVNEINEDTFTKDCRFREVNQPIEMFTEESNAPQKNKVC